MVRMSLITLPATLIALLPAWADTDGATNQFGFGYCPPPVVPGCIARSAARRPNRPTLEACRDDVLRFTQSLGTYRVCLTRESERAIGSGNAAIARFRCITGGGRGCR